MELKIVFPKVIVTTCLLSKQNKQTKIVSNKKKRFPNFGG